MQYALIDESGRLADPADKIIVFVALVTKSLLNLDKIIPQIKKKLPKKGKRGKEKTREKFNDLVQKILNKKLFVEHLDSQQNTIVSLPDFVAGSMAEAYNKKNLKYKKIIQKLITVEKKTTWRKLAQQKR